MTATMTTQLTVAGIEDSDGERCECCGTRCPKRRVVLMDSNGSFVKYGSSCAAYALTGSKKNKGDVEREARVISTIHRWSDRGFDAKTIRSGIWNKFGVSMDIKEYGLRVWINPKTPTYITI